MGAVGLATNPSGKSQPRGLEGPHGAIPALEGLIRGSARFAVFISMLDMGKRQFLEIMGVPSHAATPLFWVQHLKFPCVRALRRFLPVVLHGSGTGS